MTLSHRPSEESIDTARIRSRVEAEAYVASVCFKHGPPTLAGVELEWTVHHRADPRRPLDADTLASALGAHAPTMLVPDSPHLPLPSGSMITVEPGGQVEISCLPQHGIRRLVEVVDEDRALLTELLGAHDLRLGTRGIDPWRPANRLLHTPRYDAMERAFDRIGPGGKTMMCSTAGLQVCLDAGEIDEAPLRWSTLHALGPILIATFANSRQAAGAPSGWASARMRSLFATDPVRVRPGRCDPDPAGQWARRVLDTPTICVRRPGQCWDVDLPMRFADWIEGSLSPPPGIDDLDYHLTTLFPPVRPRGYLEVRYLDAQPGADWAVPALVLIALFAQPATVARAAELSRPAAHRWITSARDGLADPVLAAAAPKVIDLACAALCGLDLPADLLARVVETAQRRAAGVTADLGEDGI
ncbi:ergothioneine biosynthesis glutamate--cysteine ligase EgtA [Actinoalloteichus hymeniacidonis]|uniref:Glutamate--cysteine ligase EgtA n=1 Tax=Actinoalloteichus hymeniacidonis TaxID=340345 RepID=A0AAC9HP59_9PSEU|nr:ergothioneine biosynthesis glutamate--cysteine ligase EgtA [Actinoalloteichus hymeniacidonis]AOS62974.1 ergothioneine biosynthesis glutamate--cysteine ligase EgtA [Actinoalloteichus hymeniacidonis]MBB5908991.1 glutamate--cysteine ligase [Actinoalloteichus hymeniacidonis]